MPHNTKIATCCYCGTRAALVLRGRERHELACSACGAPLHDMKMLRTDAVDPQAHRPARTGRPGTRRPAAHGVAPLPHREREARKLETPRRKPKKRKNLARRFFEEAFDAIEDIFD